jgi:hypothetical protein
VWTFRKSGFRWTVKGRNAYLYRLNGQGDVTLSEALYVNGFQNGWFEDSLSLDMEVDPLMTETVAELEDITDTGMSEIDFDHNGDVGEDGEKDLDFMS